MTAPQRIRGLDIFPKGYFLGLLTIFVPTHKNNFTGCFGCFVLLLIQSSNHIARTKKLNFRGVAQLVARLLWEQEVQSSSLCTPTKTAVFNENSGFLQLFR